MYIMAKEAKNPKPSMQIEWYCLAIHKNTHKHIFVYAGDRRLPKKSDFVVFFLLLFLSHTKLLTSIAYTKAVIEPFHAQNDITFIVVAPFSPFVCKLARAAVLASCGSAKFQRDAILRQQTKCRNSDVCLLCMQKHFLPLFAYDGCV